MKTHLKLQILAIISETADCKTYVFNSPELSYQAGQFLTFILNTGNHQIRRAYSFSSSPKIDLYPSITVKRIENGEGSRHILNHWKTGDIVEAIEPVGRFTLPKVHPKELLLFAAGSGIVPIYSILKSALQSASIEKIHLFYSNKSTTSTIFLKELIDLELAYSEKLDLHWFFSDNIRIIDARINGEYIEKYYQTNVIQNINEIQVYACGPENFMYLCEVSSKYAGILPDNYHQETFYREEIESHVPHQFVDGEFDLTFKLKAGIYKIKVAGNQTILSQAIKNRVPVNWSCFAGRCSTCMLHLNAGEVYLSRNEVLTNKDLMAGLTITCTAYPIKGPLELEEK